MIGKDAADYITNRRQAQRSHHIYAAHPSQFIGGNHLLEHDKPDNIEETKAKAKYEASPNSNHSLTALWEWYAYDEQGQ